MQTLRRLAAARVADHLQICASNVAADIGKLVNDRLFASMSKKDTTA